VAHTLDRLKTLPVDIQPVFITADELTRAGQ
jgi:hypothetical protein